MKYTTAKTGRTFVIRLEDGEILHEQVEKFAAAHQIKAASVKAIGGAGKGSIIIVGPEESHSETIKPMEHILEEAHEITGVGTIFPDKEGKPVLHMHIACGRKDKTITGCVRKGVSVWLVMEVIITELLECKARRLLEKETGFELLQP